MNKEKNTIDETISDEEIKKHILPYENDIRNRDGWLDIKMPQLSQDELLKCVEENGLENDEQTRLFVQFVTLANNFSSMEFKKKLRELPQLIKTIRDLINEFKKDAKKYADIGNKFED